MSAAVQIAKPYLSVSQLTMLERCGEQYRRRYIEGEKVPPGIAAVVGTAVHGSAAYELNTKLQSDGMLPSVEEVHDAARLEFSKAYERGVLWTADERATGVEKILGAKIDETIGLATAYHKHYAPVLEPMPDRVEWQWRIATDYSHDLLGIIDVVTDSAEDGLVVHDLKTSGRTPPATDAELSEQLTFYALAIRAEYGFLPHAVKLDYLVNSKGGVKAVTQTSTRDERSLQVLDARVERAVEVIAKGAFTPARPTDWWCSIRWCGFAPTCPFYAGRIAG